MFEITVKKNMIEEVRRELDLTKEELFDPEDTDVSDDYGIAGGNAKPEDRFKFAKTIYNDNVNGIRICDTLVFPKFTTDLGTLYEVGFAIGLGKKIYRYNFLSRTLEPVDYKPVNWDKLRININPVREIGDIFNAVSFGVLASDEEISKYLIYHFPKMGSLSDNLMFAANFKFKDSSGKVLLPEERDWEGGIR